MLAVKVKSENQVPHMKGSNIRLEHDRYRFLDLETGLEKTSLPSSTHYRLNRKKFRQLLSTDIIVQWGKQFKSFETTADGILVHFADGSRVEGSLLLAVDGKNSRIRRLLLGEENSRLVPLPVGFMGFTLSLSPEKMQPFREIHPVLWQGCHPGSGYFVFFSMLSTPNTNGSAATTDPYYEGQFNMSWLIDQNGPTPKTQSEQIRKAKEAAIADTGMFSTLKQGILSIPEDTPALEIKLEDWPPQHWPSHGGRVSLLGDAAHTMTMCKYISLIPPLHYSFRHRSWGGSESWHLRCSRNCLSAYAVERQWKATRTGHSRVSVRS